MRTMICIKHAWLTRRHVKLMQSAKASIRPVEDERKRPLRGTIYAQIRASPAGTTGVGG